MFKLSVISDEVSQDLEDVVRFARGFELNGIEIRTLWNQSPQKLLDSKEKIKQVLSECSLEVSAIASPFFKADIDSEQEYLEHLAILKKCVNLARDLDTPLIRGFTFWRRGVLEDNIERIIDKYQSPLNILEDEDITLGIENEPSTSVGNGRELAVFLSRLGSKKVKAVWDPANDCWDSTGETPYPDGYRYVKDWIVHVHIKDAIRHGEGGKPESAPIGLGEVNFPSQLKALKADGYNGYLSLETHWRPKNKLSEENITKPGGEEFSRFGRQASEICMRNLRQMLSKI